MKAAEWIDQVKAHCGWESDYRAAKELGLSRQTVSAYRSKPDTTLDDETAEKVAQALRIEPEYIALDQLAERTRVDSVRAGVTRLLNTIRGKARGSSGAAGSGRGRVDITSAASSRPEGEPREPRSKVYTSCHPRKASPVQLLQRALHSLVSPAAPLAHA